MTILFVGSLTSIYAQKNIEVNFDLEEKSLLLEQVVISASKDEINRKEAVTLVNVVIPKTFESTNSVCLADGLSFQLNAGMKNIFNSFQKDFDKGEFRDA